MKKEARKYTIEEIDKKIDKEEGKHNVLAYLTVTTLAISFASGYAGTISNDPIWLNILAISLASGCVTLPGSIISNSMHKKRLSSYKEEKEQIEKNNVR